MKEWKRICMGFSSRLLRIECFRTIDRLRLRQNLASEDVALRLSGLQEILSHIGGLPLTPRVQEKAEHSYPTPIGTLDGIHLATALLWKDIHGNDFSFATHDEELALAAKAHGFDVVGI